MLFMANAYARHINGDVLERAIFEYDYVVAVDLPEGARTLAAGAALSDTRDPCFYARRHGRRLYMGYEEMAETSPEIMRAVAPRTLDEGKRVFPALTDMDECDIRSAWSGRVYFTLDDYPFVERRHGGRVITFAARPITATRWRCASASSSATSPRIRPPRPGTTRTYAGGTAMRGSSGCSRPSPRGCGCVPAGAIRRRPSDPSRSRTQAPTTRIHPRGGPG